jgi:antitoxin ParD1/3/4
LIDALVTSGRYRNASDVLRDGLRLIESREIEEATKREALRAAAQIGVESFTRGDFKEFENAAALTAYLDGLNYEIAESIAPSARPGSIALM